MNLEPAPRFGKTWFFLAAAGFFTVALLIGLLAPNRFEAAPLICAVVSFAISAALVMFPVISDFVAENREYVQAEQLRLTQQAQRLQVAVESLARAAAQIKSIEEAVQKSATTAENLPYRMQEKLAEFNETLAARENEEREILERELDEQRGANSANLKAVADKLAKATAEWAALEAINQKQLAAAQSAAAQLNAQLQASVGQLETCIAAATRAAVEQLEARFADLAPKASAVTPISAPLAPAVSALAPTPPHAPAAPPTAAEALASLPPAVETPVMESTTEMPPAAPSVIESVTLTETSATVVAEPKPKKPRVPRKPKPEDLLAAMSSDSTPENAEGQVGSSPRPAAGDETSAPAATEASVSSDGATRLLVTAYIGIGNKLFIRGEGPGLSWDKGVPMQFVSIGKWGWASHDVTAPVKAKLYKNDQTAALSGDVTIAPGKHVEFTALF